MKNPIVVAADYIKQIWVPDTFFVNEKTAYFHVATQENQFLRITHLGEILRQGVKVERVFSCESTSRNVEIVSRPWSLSDDVIMLS